VTIDVAVGQMRAFEFNAATGAIGVPLPQAHHTMNAMGTTCRR